MSAAIRLGVKTDPIETRFSFEWLFDLMREEGARDVQVGSFYELYWVEDDYFADVRRAAEERGLRVRSVFTAHRELGGFFTGDKRLERAARKGYERLIRVAAVLGAEFCGSNPGAVYRDRAAGKAAGLDCYLGHMRELMEIARGAGLKALTMEPMSCLAEPPSTPEEITAMMEAVAGHHRAHPGRTVPVYLCADISHGLVDAEGRTLHTNVELFEHGAPWMAEFHFKNTDAQYNSTFGFSEAERARGTVDLAEWRGIVERNAGRYPVAEVTGYLEIGGPKVGRDYSDPKLGTALRESLRAIRGAFGPGSCS